MFDDLSVCSSIPKLILIRYHVSQPSPIQFSGLNDFDMLDADKHSHTAPAEPQTDDSISHDVRAEITQL